jgi:hypothetical protein
MWWSSRKIALPGLRRGAGAQASFFDHLTPTEQQCWLAEMVAWLEQKMQREQAYLARRQARSRYYTATDEAYERDSVYEQALLGFLREMELRQREERR